MASKSAPDNRSLPSKEQGLFRQLAKQYEVRRAACDGIKVFGTPRGRHDVHAHVKTAPAAAKGAPGPANPNGPPLAACGACLTQLSPALASARLQTKQYKKGIKNADTILKKFPEHGETLAMKVLTLAVSWGVRIGRGDAAVRVLLTLHGTPPQCGHPAVA